MKNNGAILIFSGCAGSGKGTVLSRLTELDGRFRPTVSLTTRTPRPGEVHGVNYYYTTREDFLEQVRQGNMTEYAEYCGNLYGTLTSEIHRLTQEGRVAVLEIETAGARQIMEKFPQHRSIFIAPPSYTVLEKRLRGRGTETEEQLHNRLEAAKEEILLCRHYQHLVINHDGAVEESARAILALMNGLPTQDLPIYPDKEAFIDHFLTH